jgi:putative colanic acid biosynthesis acetyltransferase WcaF
MSADAKPYRSPLPLRMLMYRAAWGVFYWCFYRFTPRWTLNGYRSLCLRAFGATVGRGCRIDPTCRIWAPCNLSLGAYACLAEGVECYTVDTIRIGTKCCISQRTFLCTASHAITSLERPLIHSPISIGDHAWVCAEAFVGPGVEVGEGSVVAARAVLTRSVGPFVVVAGNPARIVKQRILVDRDDPRGS